LVGGGVLQCRNPIFHQQWWSNSPAWLPFWLIYHMHMYRSSAFFSLLKQVFIPLQDLPVKHFHSWTFTTFYTWLYPTFGVNFICRKPYLCRNDAVFKFCCFITIRFKISKKHEMKEKLKVCLCYSWSSA
jgi:hypothetical protein